MDLSAPGGVRECCVLPSAECSSEAEDRERWRQREKGEEEKKERKKGRWVMDLGALERTEKNERPREEERRGERGGGQWGIRGQERMTQTPGLKQTHTHTHTPIIHNHISTY